VKLLKETYKTYEGARKRAAFENALAKGEYEKGYKAKHYRYGMMQQSDGTYRVYRDTKSPDPADALRYHVTGAIERGEKTAIVEKRD
jgi:hypothetical protein